MNEIEIKQKLDQLAEFHAQRDVAAMEKQRLIDEILTPEIKARIAEIEAEFAGKTEAVNENIAALEAEIKKDVAEYGASVKGSVLHAVFSKGRVSWDTKGLDGYIIDHPELAKFREEGKPSVSIRAVK
jgi:phage host-nuclease inhibitor protein Gam